MSQNQPPSTSMSSHEETHAKKDKLRFDQVRKWLRSRTGRVVIPLVTLFIGVVFGIFAVFLFGSSSTGPFNNVTEASQGSIIVEANRAYLTQLVTKNLSSSGMPGQIENVNVNLEQGNLMTVRGDDGFSVFGIRVSKHFTFVVQPYVSSCVLKIHIVRADFSNIPVTRFAQSFESQINQQLQVNSEGLPNGFHYCITGVRTEPAGMFVTYPATPN